VKAIYSFSTSNKTKPPDSADADDVKKLERKMANLEEDYAATQKTFREVTWKHHHMKERFKELREVSGLSSTEDIIKTFVKNEDECFSLFNYIQEMNQECDKTILQASKLRKEIDKCRQDQLERENSRSATMTVYTELKKEAQNEREKGYTTSIECRRTVETISRRVTSLYFKLKCHELADADKDKVLSKDSLPPQLKTDRKLTTIGGGEVSERNILNLMEMIETRSIQIVDAYLKLSTSKRSRRPSLILVRIVI
jgi:coiled-coil domain-containing protein 63/114